MNPEHFVVYRQTGRFAGWPANYGLWHWGDEIVVGFTGCAHLARAGFHARDETQPAVPMQARSLDGGITWVTVPIPADSPGGRGFSADEHMVPELRAATAIEAGLAVLPAACPGGLDFNHPDFGLMCARTGLGTGTSAWFYTTRDRAHSWQGPYALPSFGLAGVEARTDVLMDGPLACTLFLTASRADGGEGLGIFTARTTDGGRSFQFGAWVDQSEAHHLIMPSSVRTDRKTILTAVRCFGARSEFEKAPTWIDLYESDDNGMSFQCLARPVPDAGSGGNPPSLILLADGRLCLTYGHRAKPFGIRAVLSSDGGRTWDEALQLRDDGGCPDLGYPRSFQRADGTVVVVYYFNEDEEGERFIAATHFRP